MADAAVTRAYLQSEIESLEPFALIAAGPAGKPLQMIEVTRRKDSRLEVRVPGRPPIAPPLSLPIRSALHARGFVSSDPADPTRPWGREVADPAAAVDQVWRLLSEVFGEKPDVSLDLIHGSHREEHEAEQKLAQMRERIERVLTEDYKRRPEQDDDGDYLLPIDSTQICVAPYVAPGGPAVARVFAITNVGVSVTPELGLFLARLNFGLMFGRFALDAEHRSIWFDETLLGDQFTDDELRFTIKMVGSTAALWDQRLTQMFGGATHPEILAGQVGLKAPPNKPGRGGYL
jgi:hypothetical protein